jgi:hypothetical protein
MSAPQPLAVVQADTAPTDVVAKSSQKKAAKRASAKKQASPPAVVSNPTKLLRHLQRLLNKSDFVAVNLSAAGLATGIPAGSVNAAMKKLLGTGQLLAGPGGRFKLAQ